MYERGQMVCPDCGVEMNRHAEKVEYTDAGAEDEGFEPALGGVLEEFHACPHCGRTRARRAA